MKKRNSIFLFKIILQVFFFLYATSLAYSECIKGNCSSGQGTATYANGDKYVGEWKDDKRHGQGTGSLANGGKYIGEWKNDKKDGMGTLTSPDGSQHSGEWKDGELLPKGSEQ